MPGWEGRRRTSHGRPFSQAEDFVHSLREPREAPALERLGQARARDQHEIVAGRQPVRELLERRAQAALQAVPVNRSAQLARDREAEPRRAFGIVLARKGVEDEEPGRDRPALAIDGVEIAGARKAMLASAHADRRFRPFARRRLRIARPARVDIRARNPCRRFRRRTFGWYVRFTR